MTETETIAAANKALDDARVINLPNLTLELRIKILAAQNEILMEQMEKCLRYPQTPQSNQ